MSDEEQSNSNNEPDDKKRVPSYLEAILKVDLLEETGKINYEDLFANLNRRLNDGKTNPHRD